MTNCAGYEMTLDPKCNYMKLIFSGQMSEAVFNAFEADLNSKKAGALSIFHRPAYARATREAAE